jgi:hypothetical protein
MIFKIIKKLLLNDMISDTVPQKYLDMAGLEWANAGETRKEKWRN